MLASMQSFVDSLVVIYGQEEKRIEKILYAVFVIQTLFEQVV